MPLIWYLAFSRYDTLSSLLWIIYLISRYSFVYIPSLQINVILSLAFFRDRTLISHSRLRPNHSPTLPFIPVSPVLEPDKKTSGGRQIQALVASLNLRLEAAIDIRKGEADDNHQRFIKKTKYLVIK